MSDSIRQILPAGFGEKLVDLGEVSPAGGIPLANIEEALDALEMLDVVILGGGCYVLGPDGIYREQTKGIEGWAFDTGEQSQRDDDRVESLRKSRENVARLRSQSEASRMVVELIVSGPSGEIWR
jgi:hypothetical protein